MRFDRFSILTLALGLVLLIPLGFGGCAGPGGRDQVQEQKDRNTAQVAANLRPIADELSVTGRPAEGAAITAQVAVLDGVVGLAADKRPAPVVTAQQWREAQANQARLEALVERLGANAAEMGRELETIQASQSNLWTWAQNSAAVGGALSVGLALARAFNVPGSSLIDAGVHALVPKAFTALHEQVADLSDRNAALVTTVQASDVGREGLAHLDQVLAARPEAQRAVLAAVQGVTGSRAGSIEDLFKTFAAAHATDAGASSAVQAVLAEVRSEAPTTGGTSDAFHDILGSMRTASAAATAASQGGPAGGAAG